MSVAIHEAHPPSFADSAVPAHKALGILAAATLVCLAPFINKAYCIDDPLFLWAAEQIQSHPLDFYGCEVNWTGTPTPLYRVTKNPPLACYYIAVVAELAGWSEPAMHTAFLLPAIGAIWGTWYLARSLCRRPVSAALATLATPVFLVSSTNLMSDTMMLCCWIWVVALWLRGIDSADWRWLAFASFLTAVASLSKYFAVSLIPLLSLYTVIRKGKATRELAWMLVPIVLLAAYQWWTENYYGRGLLDDAGQYALGVRWKTGSGSQWASDLCFYAVVALCFTGGLLTPVLFCSPWLWSWRWIGAAAAAALGMAACAHWIPFPHYLESLPRHQFPLLAALQLGLFAACGALVVWLAVSEVVTQPSADACLLGIWVLGTFGFAGFLNWTCNGRSILPLAPAFAILLVRRAERSEKARPARAQVPRVAGWQWALAPAAVVALTVAWADFCLAGSARAAATQIAGDFPPNGNTLWFQGHWGFQYYMRKGGGRELNQKQADLHPGDWLVNPYNNDNVRFFDSKIEDRFVDRVRDLEIPACPCLSTLDARVGAGFYSARHGPLPYVYGPAPLQKYEILRIKLPIR